MGKEKGKIILAGAPNVGKSLLFHQLSGSYAAVSNYPGTTVEVFRGKALLAGRMMEIIDTPGMYSLLPVTEEERAARNILLSEKPSLVLHVVDGKNLPRHLPVTLQLMEAGFRVLLVVNMMDEAKKAGIRLDTAGLSRRLGIPVVPTALLRKQGLAMLKAAIGKEILQPTRPLQSPSAYPHALEEPLKKLSSSIKGHYGISRRSAALLLLCGDDELGEAVKKAERHGGKEVIREAESLRKGVHPSPAYLWAMARYSHVRNILDGILVDGPEKEPGAFGDLLIQPLTGIPVLLAVLYFGLYRFVGRLGAGRLVGLLDYYLFESFLVPWTDSLALRYLPGDLLPRILALEYGLVTLGLRYAVAIVLPIVGTFFFFFAFLEDSGYLPRLAMLADRFLKKLGLSGRAVIPLALGLGCGTMAVIVTRTLESRRERIIASFLLALAVPCSAQLGLFFGVLEGVPLGLLIWMAVVLLGLVTAGFLADRFLPGEKQGFYLEIPPLRLPSPGNIAKKTFARMGWYFQEVLPVFLLISLFISLGQAAGILDFLVRLLDPLMGLLRLPREMSLIFLVGFLRRDYGAAGLYDLAARGILDPPSLVVAAVTLTLFLPCMAQMSVLFRERGILVSLVMILLVAAIALGSGILLRFVLSLAGL